MGWEPVLVTASLSAAAWDAVRAIADQINDVPAVRERPEDLTLFWAYAAGAFDDDASAARFDAATTRLVARIEQGYAQTNLIGGLAGAGWVLAHINDGGADEILAAVDQALVDVLAADGWTEQHDLLTGLAGYAVYFVERLAAGEVPVARTGLERVVAHLDALAQPTDHGTTWHTAPELLPAWQRERAPTGHRDCGVAHGVPGVVAALGAVAALPDPPSRAAPLCAAGMAWMRAQRLAPDPRGRYPAIVGGGPGPDRARTAWCYGDPGIAAAMWSAAIRIDAPVSEWRELAAEVAARPAELTGVIDAAICHGAVGLAHLCNRYYQASGDPVFRAASVGWFERALAMRRPGEGIGGFLAEAPRAHGAAASRYVAHDLLEGSAGIGLALLAALGHEPPGWDRVLACDIPVRTP